METFAELPSTISDRYIVERVLGGGAMSCVHLATDRELGRRVAIKTLAPELASVLKPENILLADRHAVVTDFGIAKVVIAGSELIAPADTVTGSGMSVGTPVYMAPEQATADETADHRVDLYALGVVAYEMLAGRPPFAGCIGARLVAAHVMKRPTPVAELRPEVPVALAELVMRCLEKDPAHRPQRGDEIVRVLESPVIAPPARRWARHRVVAGIVALTRRLSARPRRAPGSPHRHDAG